MARFRAIYSERGKYIIQKYYWDFGWAQYDKKLYYASEAKQRLMVIKTLYPNVRPINGDVLEEIEVKRD